MVRRLKCVLGSPVPFLLGVQGGSHGSPKPDKFHAATVYPCLYSEDRQSAWLTPGSEFYYHQCPEWEDDPHPWQALFVPLLFASSLPILRCSWWEMLSPLLFSPPQCSGLWLDARTGWFLVGDFVEYGKMHVATCLKGQFTVFFPNQLLCWIMQKCKF